MHPKASVTVTKYVPAESPFIGYDPPNEFISFPLGLPFIGPFQLTLYGKVP